MRGAAGLKLALAGGLLLALLAPAAAGPPLRVLTAAAATPLLGASGLDVSRDGTTLRWRGGEYHVADECSGVRKLWAALALAVGLAALRGLAARATAGLVVVAGAAAVAGNAVRVGALVYVEMLLGVDSRLLHDGAGLAAFGLVVAVILAAARRAAPAE